MGETLCAAFAAERQGEGLAALHTRQRMRDVAGVERGPGLLPAGPVGLQRGLPQALGLGRRGAPGQGMVERARAGKLKFVGDGQNLVDTTYIDNAAQAHLDAFDALHDKPGAACAGKAYFISNGEPKPIADIVNSLLRATGAPTVTQLVPFRAAYAVGTVMEALYGLLPLKGEPLMTRFLAEQLSVPHYYDISAARRDFGYQPRISIIEGLRQLGAWWRKREGG